MHIMKSHKYVAAILLTIGYVAAYAQPNSPQNPDKTKEQVDTLIKQTGSTNPNWWDSVELSYPKTLDMNWPVTQGIWDGRGGSGRGERGQPGQRATRGVPGARGATPTNIDQYLMQIVYPNQALHKQGIKLVHQLLEMHKNDPNKSKRDMNMLGYMYYDLMFDYARAAYWWQKSTEAGGSAVILTTKLARCYYELGSKSAVTTMLNNLDSGTLPNNRDVIKLWVTIGEFDKALAMLESGSTTAGTGRTGLSGNNPQLQNNMLAGEICRQAGRYDQAIAYYQKVADTPQQAGRGGGRGGAEEGRMLNNRAKANIEALKLIKTLDLKRIPDGEYTGTGTGHEGTLTIKVTTKSGKIESIEVTQQRETPNRYANAEQVSRKITTKQGFEGIDAVTGATETSDAIINGAAKALANAMN